MKIGRNAPCPCKSGKKYKKCCLIKEGNNLLQHSAKRTGSEELTKIPNKIPTTSETAVTVPKATVSKIEMAKALKAVRDVVDSPEIYQEIKQKIIGASYSEEDINRAIGGLSEEDEFALMCRLMDTTTHLVKLSQSPIIKGDYIIPDFIAKFQPGYFIRNLDRNKSRGFKCLIEVKSTGETEFKIGGSLLGRRRKFADEFGLPLLFAVRFLLAEGHALWAIVEDKRTSTTLKVTLQDIVDGERRILWNDYSCLLWPGLYCVAVYDKESKQEWVSHKEYGVQTDFWLIKDGRRIGTTHSAVAQTYSALFEAFSLEPGEIEQEGSLTHQVLIPRLQMSSVVDVVYKMNRLPRDKDGQIVYDPSKIMTRLDQSSSPFVITRDFVDKLLTPLFRQKILAMGSMGDDEQHFIKWCEYGGQSD